MLGCYRGRLEVWTCPGHSSQIQGPLHVRTPAYSANHRPPLFLSHGQRVVRVVAVDGRLLGDGIEVSWSEWQSCGRAVDGWVGATDGRFGARMGGRSSGWGRQKRDPSVLPSILRLPKTLASSIYLG